MMKKEWDTLLICDAARYGLFLEAAPADWDVEAVRSPGTESWGFMETTWVGKQFHDTVYITANPHVGKIPEGTFHAVENLLVSDWDAEYGTVPPDAMAQRILQARLEYPKKRIIGHFMQPHFPFFGSTARNLPYHGINRNRDDERQREHPWQQMRLWHSTDEIVKAYRESHKVVIKTLADLLPQLGERVILTSDHGNLIGERGPLIPMRMYGHPRGLHMDELVTIPWVEFNGEPIKPVPERPVENKEIQDGTVEDRLEAFGYLS